ncbi:tripartite tricarboxylate transporter substrate binding protein [Streptomyces armeniacus]|uniref:Tripartite tricarboxylate transporter substrate binding protein n=1 Tax=Streptomyces armeniacus TaxID=83291 RepID=A0A345XPX5_9ACTN|nr:tripartite tricarboxylate transporter substrate binding protein [Streptomyces armeniacus]AXK33691.1 tripartite tricarboxylate transporter substrate binding protein [Streptomyces armeniacus]
MELRHAAETHIARTGPRSGGRRLTAVLSGVLASVLLAACAPNSTSTSGDSSADDYPSKGVTLTVVYPAGSAPDSTARTLAAELEKELDTNITVVNQDGGNGMVGLSQLLGEKADGHQLAFTASPPLTTSWQQIKSNFTGPDSIDPVAQTNEVPSVLFVNGDSGITSVEDFVAKAKKSKLKVGVPGASSVQRFQLEEFTKAAGIRVEQVVTDAGQQILPVVNGTLDAAVAQPSPILQYVQKGDLRMTGYFGDRKPKGLEVGTFADAGYETTFGGFEGFIAPKGVPEKVLDRLDEAVKKATASKAFTDFMAKTHGVPAFLDRAAFEKRMAADVATSKKYIDDLGLKK